MKNKPKEGNTSNVKLTKDNGGYFLEVSDKYTKNTLAITENELLLIYKVVKDEAEKLLKKVKDKYYD